MDLHKLRRWIVFFAALVLGMFLGAVEGEAQQVPRGARGAAELGT
jgi:hypothetical protein